MKKVLVIVGPTAVGKTSLSIQLAQKLQGEIISGDSIQVYQGLNIGSGKIKEEEKEGIPHVGIDTLTWDQSYSVADFQTLARTSIETITARHKLPMIVGGTGLYIKAALYDYVFKEETSDHQTSVYNTWSEEELYQELEKRDPSTAQKLHPHNRRRVQRALEIEDAQHQTKSSLEDQQAHLPLYDVFLLGCTMNRDHLYQRIDARVDQMIQEGLEEEVASLLKQGVTFQSPCMKGIGYKEWEPYFKKEENLDTVVEEIKKNSRRFAKRQYTWFNHQMPVQWVDMENEEALQEMIEKIKRWKHE